MDNLNINLLNENTLLSFAVMFGRFATTNGRGGGGVGWLYHRGDNGLRG
jgi:hypothetical protein